MAAPPHWTEGTSLTMAGIVVIAHPNLAQELVRSVQHILGRSDPWLQGLDIPVDTPYEESLERVRSAVDEVRDHHGAILTPDMYGGTPANLALACLAPGRVEVISGANLPMLVRLLTYQNRPLGEQVQKGLDGGREGVLLGRGRHSGGA